MNKLDELKAINEGVFYYDGSNKECLAKPVIKRFYKSQTGVKAQKVTLLGRNSYGMRVFQIEDVTGGIGYVLVDLEYDPWYAIAKVD